MLIFASEGLGKSRLLDETVFNLQVKKQMGDVDAPLPIVVSLNTVDGKVRNTSVGTRRILDLAC